MKTQFFIFNKRQDNESGVIYWLQFYRGFYVHNVAKIQQ